MGSHRVQIVILAEDRQHDVFLRRFLKAIRKDAVGLIRSNIAPPGVGSGEQHVREKYPVELRAHRSKAKNQALQLFVVTDADILSVEQHRQKLSTALVAVGIPSPTDQEQVAILIPKRNIETWIKYLRGESVDETTDYCGPKHGVKKQIVQPAVDRLEELYRAGGTLPDDCPDSLRQAVEELKRVLVL